MDDINNDKSHEESSGGGMDSLLEQKAKLERMIDEQYTKYITVMFTDLKGSTAIADLQGNLAARMIIKNHIDILKPIIKESNGILVKTMGDGTMSYYEREIDAVRAAVNIQKGITAFNASMEGKAPIYLRAGISSGNAFVEEDDIFGDVVNVSARFEASCNSGEVYIAEDTYEGLGQYKEEYFIRHTRNITFKGKSAPSKIFKVFYKPEEVEKEKMNPTNPDAVASTAKAAPFHVPVKAPISYRAKRPFVRTSRAVDNSARMTEHKQQASETQKELQGSVIGSGDVLKLTNEKCRVNGNIIVEKGGAIILENTELYFAEDTGIVSMGVVRAVNSVFSAMDPEKGWRNVVISAGECDRTIEIDNCKFYFGRGITAGALKSISKAAITLPQEDVYYGGGLLVSGRTPKLMKINRTSFHKCISNEGGGIYFHQSRALLNKCTFKGCMAKNGNGGAIHAFNSDVAIEGASFTKCSSGNSGGGVCYTSSNSSVTDSFFISCMSKRGGGGMACISSSPQISGCKFENCSSMMTGGGIFKDGRSNPVIQLATFQKCKPNDIA